MTITNNYSANPDILSIQLKHIQAYSSISVT